MGNKEIQKTRESETDEFYELFSEEDWELWNEAFRQLNEEIAEELNAEYPQEVTFNDRFKRKINYIFRVQGIRISYPEADHWFQWLRAKTVRMILLPIHKIGKIRERFKHKDE